MQGKISKHFSEWVISLLEGNISPEDLACLDDEITNNALARQHYIQLMAIHSGLRQTVGSIEVADSLSSTNAEEEQMEQAGEIKIDGLPCDNVLPELLMRQFIAEEQEQERTRRRRSARTVGDISRKMPYQRSRPSRHSMLQISGAIAAIVAVALILNAITHLVNKSRLSDYAVATVTDMIDVVGTLDVSRGDQVYRGTVKFKKGYLELAFKGGAQVIIEGPAEFTAEAKNKIFLSRGKLSIRTKEGSSGFVIHTDNAMFTDIGTEFGVEVNRNGDADVYVFTGQVDLYPVNRKGEKNKDDSYRVGKNQAMRITKGRAIRRLDITQAAFVRQISSDSGLIWKGNTIDLADIVSGGDGYGSGKLGAGINPANGHLVRQNKAELKSGSNKYSLIPSNPFVDGTFIPSGNTSGIQIDSQGHTFSGYSHSDGHSWGDIVSNSRTIVFDRGLQRCLPLLDGRSYTCWPNSHIYMHANAGITFDLQAIRKSVIGMRILRFKALCGIADNIKSDPRANFYVLVDGKLRFEKTNVSARDAASDIDVELNSNDRFLTLIVTEGNDNNGADICLFAKPILQLRINRPN